MMKIKDFKELELNISWKLLYTALFKQLISADDVIEYASEQLEQENYSIDVCELAGADSSDTEFILSKLLELSETEDSDNLFEERKLRAAIVSEKLKNKNSNYINGLVELTELWVQLGYPADSPHVIQGRNNSISPTDYYTESNYDYLYDKNLKWLEKELLYLRSGKQ